MSGGLSDHVTLTEPSFPLHTAERFSMRYEGFPDGRNDTHARSYTHWKRATECERPFSGKLTVLLSISLATVQYETEKEDRERAE